MKRASRWVGLALGGAFLSLSIDANACGNSMRGHRVHDPMRMLLVEAEEEVVAPRLQLAEDALREGKYVLAAAELDAVAARIRKGPPRLRMRFERVASLVTVRTDGQWPLQKSGTENKPAARVRALEAAVNQLRKRLAAAPADPIRLTDLGEALAALPRHRKEAKRILEDLAKRDLLTSAHAYAALSRLRSLAKDEIGANQALNSCRLLDEKGVACLVAAAPRA